MPVAREFQTLDVFTTRRYGGNPLAVVRDGKGLSTEQMQTIAAEFNLSETTFILPPQDAANDAHVRIFTPKAELPFAGHPTVGTAIALAEQDAAAGPYTRALRLEEQVGVKAPGRENKTTFLPPNRSAVEVSCQR